MTFAWVRRVWKQQAGYAALAAVALSAFVVFLLYSAQARGLSVVGDTYLMTTMVAFAGVGFTLGLVPTLADRRRGHWGFAVHRPVRRLTLYAAQYLAVATLYVVATTPAVLVAAACAADAKLVRAPFAFSMLLPTLFSQAAGLVWVATGMLVASRDARWVGSRLFPAAIALGVVAGGANVPAPFGVSLLILLGGLLLIGVAGAAFYVHNGAYGPQPRWVRPLSALFVMAGSGAVIIAALNVAAEGIRAATGGGGSHFLTTEYDFGIGPDGQPYRYVTKNGMAPVPFATVDGTPLSPKDANWVANHQVTTSALQSVDPDSDYGSRRAALFAPGSYLQQSLDYGSGGPRWWYVVARGVCEGMTAEGEPIGTIGSDGFHPPGETARPFPPDTRTYDLMFNETLLVGRRDVYLLSLQARDARLAFHTDDDADPICGATVLHMPAPVSRFGSSDAAARPLAEVAPYLRVVVSTRHTLRVVPLDGSPALALSAVPPDGYEFKSVSAWGNANVAVMNGGRLDRPQELLTVRDGRTTRIELPARPYKPSDPETTTARWVRQAPELLAAPPAVLWAGYIAKAVHGGWPNHSVRDLLWTLPSLALGLGLTSLAVRQTRGRSRAVWLAMGVLLGPTAALTAACLLDKLPRVRCPTCGKSRGVDRDRCEHCDATFPAPGDPATAVFDTPRSAA